MTTTPPETLRPVGPPRPEDAVRRALGDAPVVLDGGLATLLEAHGHDLSSALWSARLLLEDPAAVRRAHAEYYRAGAQVATTASYQVSATGFAAAGLGTADVATALARSVALAREAAELVGEERSAPSASAGPAVAGAGGGAADASLWVAASVGPYGASLGDGSEYRGDHDLDVAALRAWHRPRLQALVAAGPDLLALETLPTLGEVEALLEEVRGCGVPVWLSLTPDGLRTRRGEPLAEAVAMAGEVPEVVAVGVNCCDPADVVPALALVAAAGLPGVAYPNSGEVWDGAARVWRARPQTTSDAAPTTIRDSSGVAPPRAPSTPALAWVAQGARLVGGCCRVGPAGIAALSADLHPTGPPGVRTSAAT